MGNVIRSDQTGRTDFSGYDAQKCFEELINSIRKKLLVLPDDTTVLPGHGEATTIKQEKLYNPCLR